MCSSRAVALLCELHDGMTDWCARWLSPPEADRVAKDALVTVCREAMMGKTHPYGPYRRLYADCERSIRILAQGTTRQVPLGLWKSIPVPTEDKLTQVSALYACVYLAQGLTNLPFERRELLLDGLGSAHFRPGGRVEINLWLRSAPEVRCLLDTVVTTLDLHDCEGEQSCMDAVRLFENQRLKGEQWVRQSFPMARRQSVGQEPEVRDPDHTVTPHANDHVAVARPGGVHQPRDPERYYPGPTARQSDIG